MRGREGEKKRAVQTALCSQLYLDSCKCGPGLPDSLSHLHALQPSPQETTETETSSSPNSPLTRQGQACTDHAPHTLTAGRLRGRGNSQICFTSRKTENASQGAHDSALPGSGAVRKLKLYLAVVGKPLPWSCGRSTPRFV